MVVCLGFFLLLCSVYCTNTGDKGPSAAFIVYSCILLMYLNCAPSSALVFHGFLLMLFLSYAFLKKIAVLLILKYYNAHTQSVQTDYLNGLIYQSMRR